MFYKIVEQMHPWNIFLLPPVMYDIVARPLKAGIFYPEETSVTRLWHKQQ
jgi:hypothetical protein